MKYLSRCFKLSLDPISDYTFLAERRIQPIFPAQISDKGAKQAWEWGPN